MIQVIDKTPKFAQEPRFSDLQVPHLKNYQPKNKIRFVTATALFDGHDASINIMRRILQARGAEVIHLGHNRTVEDVVIAAIQEDVQAVAISSYQGGHVEYFKYLRKRLDAEGGTHIRIFGGGGGVISLAEIQDLEASGVEKIYSPEDGFKLGLDGIIGHMLAKSDFVFDEPVTHGSRDLELARILTLLERGRPHPMAGKKKGKSIPVLGITGTGGAGKSSLVDELLLRFLYDFKDIRIGLICVDPSKRKTGGALLGDRIRINACSDPRIFLRSFASRDSGKELTSFCKEAVQLIKTQDFDLVIVETSGIGQGDVGILEVSDLSLYVMTPEYGAMTQLEKIDMLDFADLIAVNKYERRQGPDAVRDVRTTLRRSRFKGAAQPDDAYPVFGTIASRFNDDGVSGLYEALVRRLSKLAPQLSPEKLSKRAVHVTSTNREALIPAAREKYLTEIAQAVRAFHDHANAQIAQVKQAEALTIAADATTTGDRSLASKLEIQAKQSWDAVDPGLRKAIMEWENTDQRYNSDDFIFSVRGKEVKVSGRFETLSHLKLQRVATPQYTSQADLARFLLRENLPGLFPFAGGIFPFRRRSEDPKRQFAGEGGPLRTNKRFHYLCEGDASQRLSTAFDSVTLYGSEPHERPDIYGKVGESGVSIAHLDDMKMLYRGFDLCAPNTSVSMTINGPAPVILAMYLNTAIDQQVDVFHKKHGRIPNPSEHATLQTNTLQAVRGTVQADILKEDQAQNTCIFSTEFALKMMGDIQEFFVQQQIRNYYAVSISGYHIAEAGANPISQLAFTLANGFTYVEYYLGRGLKIDDFAANLSFFFSNGIDAEYSVMGRVARRIWAIAMRDVYGAKEGAQKLKYHIQTSGRSLHAQEMSFNDIRTTLQALMALYDNCNSLHTNAFDEAVTTPTEDSVRRAMAIQMIINHEFGLNSCENVNQGSYFIERLTDIVEDAVLQEFERISSRGGVLGAMETQYQRSQIQEESLYYEEQKHSGKLPLIGVNTFLGKDKENVRAETNLVRASYEEKTDQLNRLNAFKKAHEATKKAALDDLASTILNNENIFAALMQTVKHCSLGEISELLFRLGGQYRRAM